MPSGSTSQTRSRRIRWALGQTSQTVERLQRRTRIMCTADPCFFHPTSPLAQKVISRLKKRCSFELPVSDEHVPSALSRRRLNDPLYMHPRIQATCQCSGGTKAVAKLSMLDLKHTHEKLGKHPRQPTPRPTDAQAAWAAAFTEQALAAERQRDARSRTGDTRPSVLSPLPVDKSTNFPVFAEPVKLDGSCVSCTRSLTMPSPRGPAL